MLREKEWAYARAQEPGRLETAPYRIAASLATRRDTSTIITVGMGTCGVAAGARETLKALQAELAKRQINATLVTVGCIGICVKEPLLDIQQAGKSRIVYANVHPDMVPRLVEEHLIKGQPVKEWVIGRMSIE